MNTNPIRIAIIPMVLYVVGICNAEVIPSKPKYITIDSTKKDIAFFIVNSM